MVALELRFLAGRYHATPWGRHVNEGVPEWPPSPWRILRALASAWRTAAPEVSREEVAGLLDALSSPPVFHLPDSRAGHTRHYMPTREPAAPNLVFDTFRAVRREDPVWVGWPSAQLSEHQRTLLRRLAGSLSYLGRAESWVQACLVEDMPAPNCVPVAREGNEDGSESETIRLLVPEQPLDLDRLMAETADLRRARLLVPPGSRWMRYILPRSVGRARSAPASQPGTLSQRLSAARYLLDAKVLPAVTETLMVGHKAREAAMSWYGRLNGGASSPTLSGKDESGAPLEGHRHAFYLATDEDEDGKLDHLTIWAREGFSRREIEALSSIPEVKWGRADETRVRLALLGFGDDMLARRMAPRLFGPSRRWTSFSPFVLVRHAKVRKEVVAGRTCLRVVDGPADQLRRELQHHGHPADDVEICGLAPPRFHWVRFRRRRPSGPPPVGGAYGFELRFPSEVTGPVTLGYGCHFGLGLFLSEDRG